MSFFELYVQKGIILSVFSNIVLKFLVIITFEHLINVQTDLYKSKGRTGRNSTNFQCRAKVRQIFLTQIVQAAMRACCLHNIGGKPYTHASIHLLL